MDGRRGGNTVFVERGGPIQVVGFFGREIWSFNNQPRGCYLKELNDMSQGVFGMWHIFIFLMLSVKIEMMFIDSMMSSHGSLEPLSIREGEP
jgi:hypothetical protein